MLPITDMYLTNHNRPKKKIIKLKGIVVHYTGNYNKGADAVANRNYFNTTNESVSAHYIVDDKSIIRCIPDNEIAYHVGAKSYTEIGKKIMENGYNPNYFLIGVEMCVNSDGDWNKTYQNTVELVAYLFQKHNLTVLDLYRHYDITGKLCPAMMIDEADWNVFREAVKNKMDKPVLKKGSKGDAVKELQQNLLKLGYDLGKWGADGDFGNATYEAVKKLQKDYGLKDDGIVGKQTYALIDSLLEEHRKEIEKIMNESGYHKIRRFGSDVHIYVTSKDEFVDVELGQIGKLETVKAIMDIKKKEGKNVVAGINCGFFNFSGNREHLGMYIDEGKYYYPPESTFMDFIYYKDGRTEIMNLNGYDKAFLSKLQAEAHWAIGTSWCLVKEGKINLENAEKFSHSKENHPRSMFGQRKDGTFVLVVVDGRSKTSRGVTAQESAEIMLELGCWNACNNDGGGSAYMVVNDKLVSKPSDGSMRAVGSVMLVYSNKPIQQSPSTLPLLKLGSKGQEVKTLQMKLNNFGYNLVVDGIFGPKTDETVRDFQKKNGLVVDGIVGPKTWAKLL